MFSAFFRGRRRCCCPHKKVTLMARCTSSISLCLLTLLTSFAFAQKGAPQDDKTGTPALKARPHATSRKHTVSRKNVTSRKSAKPKVVHERTLRATQIAPHM